jgi:hypothetical protein
MLCTADYALSLLSHGHNNNAITWRSQVSPPPSWGYLNFLRRPILRTLLSPWFWMIYTWSLRNFDKKIRNVDNFESQMPMAGDMLASCKVTTRVENFTFQALQFQNTGVHHNGLYWCLMGLISLAWSHSLTRTRNLIYVPKRLAPIVAIRIVHMVFPSKITSRYFTWFTNVIFKIWRYSTGLGPRQKK